uniref:histidine kinase n=1 Tax=Fundidesulfovibrio putealis TaxID=270496 RepID=A0A7C4AFT1_9BACT
MANRKRTVASAISLALITVTTLVLTVFGCAEYYRQYANSYNRLKTQLLVSTEQLSLSLALPIWNFQYEQAEKLIESQMLDRDVAAVQVTDLLTGRVLATRVRDDAWLPRPAQDVDDDPELLRQRGGVFYNSRHIAILDVWMSPRFVRQALREHLLYMIVQILVLNLAIVGLLWIVLNRAIVRPLKRVELHAAGVVDDAAQPSPLPPQPELLELDSLQSSINRMVSYLQNRIGEARLAGDRITSIMDAMPSLMIGIDGNARITHWNHAARERTGLDDPQVLGKPLVEALPGFVPYMEPLLGALERLEPATLPGVSCTLGGETRHCDVMAFPVLHQGGRWAVVRVDDVTDRLRMDQLIIQTEKMMSLGGLAAGMAHEINNPLAGILQNVQNVQRRIQPDLPGNQAAAREAGVELERVGDYLERRGIPEFLRDIRYSGERAARIVQNMLSFTRSTCSQGKCPVRLDELADRVLTIAATDYNLKKKYDFRHISIVRDYAPDLPPVTCSPMEIEQVLLNLLRNAAQALAQRPEGEAGADTPEPTIRIRLFRDGDCAVMEVSDNGPGMEKEVGRRVFEPFFTTKSPGEGTGLGLSVSYFIITRNHQGSISLDTAPGRGAVFTVRLPLAPGPEAPGQCGIPDTPVSTD